MQRSAYFFTWGRLLTPKPLFSKRPSSLRRLSTSTTNIHKSTALPYVSYFSPQKEDRPSEEIHGGGQEESFRGVHRPIYIETLAHTVLREYLNIPTQEGRKKYYDSVTTDWRSLPAITMSFLHWKAHYPLQSMNEIPHISKIFERDFDLEQLERWAWIVSADSSDNMVARLKSLEPLHVPAFVILQVLRGDLSEPKSLNDLLAYLERCGIAQSHQIAQHNTNGKEEEVSVSNVTYTPLYKPTEPLQDRPIHFEDTQFMIMISSLLKQARRIWSPAVVDVVRLAERFLLSSFPNTSGPFMLDTRLLERLCGFINTIMVKLSLPASAEPLKATTYSWTAQKRLLVLTGKFEPPLILNRMSYLSIITVLSGSKKTEQEDWVATHRTRTWPPWRVDQDGMDAKRLPEEDLSRVVLGLTRMKEAGIRGSSDVLKIFGGQDSDGTPTIHTRKLLSLRDLEAWTDPNGETLAGFEPDLPTWVARIEATRDVQEAWSAFKKFLELGGRPHLDLYFPMLQKLNYENARLDQKHVFDAAPGDGREVFPPANDNISEYYKMTLQPPSYEELYEHMLSSEVQPEGRCLSFLLQHARTLEEGFRYLRDSGLGEMTVSLIGLRPNGKTSTRFLKEAGRMAFAGFLAMLCRFAPRAVLKPSEEFEKSTAADAEENTAILSASVVPPQRSQRNDHQAMPRERSLNRLQLEKNPEQEATSENPTSERVQSLKDLWTIVEIQKQTWKRYYIANPLSHAISLLTLGKIRWVPAWYAVFRGLARDGVLTSHEYIGESLNDEYSWRISIALFKEFHGIGLKLTSQGFLLLCQTFDKFALATIDPNKVHNHSLLEMPDVLKIEFDRLLETAEATDEDEQPKFLHLISGLHLHAYIRCLGHVKNHEEIVRVLRWMITHRQRLDELAGQARNGDLLMRRALIAVRIFLDGTEHNEVARGLIESVDCWLGWPHDFEVKLYKDNGGWEEEEALEEEQNDEVERLNAQEHIERETLLLKQGQLQEKRRVYMEERRLEKERQREKLHQREKERQRERQSQQERRRQLKKERQTEKEQQLENEQQLEWARQHGTRKLCDIAKGQRVMQNEEKSYPSFISFRPGEGGFDAVLWPGAKHQPKMDKRLDRGGQPEKLNLLAATQLEEEQQTEGKGEGGKIEPSIRRVMPRTGQSMLFFKFEAANDGRTINMRSSDQNRLRHQLERRRKLAQEEELKKDRAQLALLLEEVETGKGK